MSQQIGNLGIRWLFAGGIGLLFVGGCVAGLAEGFGDSPPPISQSVHQRWIGIAIAAFGIATAVGSAITLYVVENRRRD